MPNAEEMRSFELSREWPSTLKSIRYTIHLGPNELKWDQLIADVKGWPRFRIGNSSLRATISGSEELGAGAFHGHLEIVRAANNTFTIEWLVTQSQATPLAQPPLTLSGVPKFLEHYSELDLRTLVGISVAFFSFDLSATKPLLSLPYRPPDAPAAPVIAGLDFEFPNAAHQLMRAHVTQFTDKQELHISLMLRINFAPTDSLLERLTESATMYVQAFLSDSHPESAQGKTSEAT